MHEESEEEDYFGGSDQQSFAEVAFAQYVNRRITTDFPDSFGSAEEVRQCMRMWNTLNSHVGLARMIFVA